MFHITFIFKPLNKNDLDKYLFIMCFFFKQGIFATVVVEKNEGIQKIVKYKFYVLKMQMEPFTHGVNSVHLTYVEIASLENAQITAPMLFAKKKFLKVTKLTCV